MVRNKREESITGQDDDDVPDEKVTLSLIFKQMQKVLQSNKSIKNEVA